MKSFVLSSIAIWSLVGNSSAQFCDETGSHNKTWTIQARVKEVNRDRRQNYYQTLTKEQLERISDFDINPTNIMTCGMGFSNGLGKVFIDGKAGFIDTTGKIVIKPTFKDAGRFSENLAPVEFQNGKWGYINKKGKIVIKSEFDWALIFREGRALIQIGEKWGFINSTGKIIIKPQFVEANSFSEGLALYQIWGVDELYGDNFKVLKTGYIDNVGNWIIKPTWDGGNDFQDRKAIVSKHLTDNLTKKTSHGCFWIDNKGTKISEELEICSTSPYELNLLDKTEIDLVFEDNKTGYRHKSGKYIWKPTK
jgi:WG containing repeat